MRRASLTPSHIAAALLLLAIIIVGAFLFFSGTPQRGAEPSTPTPEPQPTTPAPTPAETTPPPPPPKPARQSWVLLTATRNTIPYAIHSALAGMFNTTLRDYLSFTLQTVGASALETTTSWDEGKGELALTSLNIVYQYSMEVDAWALQPPKRSAEMSVIIYQFPVFFTIFVTEDLADKVKCWRDVATVGRKGGEGIYVPSTGTGLHPVFRRVFSALLGVRPLDLENHLNLHAFAFPRLPDELAAGRVKILWGTGDGMGPAPWLTSALARVNHKMVAVPPCTDELERLRMLSDLTLLPLDLTPYNVKTREGKSIIDLTVSTPVGILGSARLSKEHVYQFVKAHFANCKAVEERVAGMRGFCTWGIELNLKAFKTQTIYGAKVHPGTALAFKELGHDLEKIGVLVARE